MRPTPDQIIGAVSLVSGVPYPMFFGARCRTSTHVEATATAIVLLRDLRGMSYPEIATFLRRGSQQNCATIQHRANTDWLHLAKCELREEGRPIPDPGMVSAWQRLEAMLGRKGALLAMEQVLLKALKEGVPA